VDEASNGVQGSTSIGLVESFCYPIKNNIHPIKNNIDYVLAELQKNLVGFILLRKQRC